MNVFVYYNLHRNLWSIKCLDAGQNKGKVIAHRTEVVLGSPKPKVSEAGRQRVLKEKQKNVHAGLVGIWHDTKIIFAGGDKITYDPYKYNTFVYADTKMPFTGASMAMMLNGEVIVI